MTWRNKAYALYLKEDGPYGHAEERWSEAEAQLLHAEADQPNHQDEHRETKAWQDK